MVKVIALTIMVIEIIILGITEVIGIHGMSGMITIDTIEIGIMMEDITEKMVFCILSLKMKGKDSASQLEDDYFKSLSKMFGKTNM